MVFLKFVFSSFLFGSLFLPTNTFAQERDLIDHTLWDLAIRSSQNPTRISTYTDYWPTVICLQESVLKQNVPIPFFLTDELGKERITAPKNPYFLPFLTSLIDEPRCPFHLRIVALDLYLQQDSISVPFLMSALSMPSTPILFKRKIIGLWSASGVPSDESLQLVLVQMARGEKSTILRIETLDLLGKIFLSENAAHSLKDLLFALVRSNEPDEIRAKAVELFGNLMDNQPDLIHQIGILATQDPSPLVRATSYEFLLSHTQYPDSLIYLEESQKKLRDCIIGLPMGGLSLIGAAQDFEHHLKESNIDALANAFLSNMPALDSFRWNTTTIHEGLKKSFENTNTEWPRDPFDMKFTGERASVIESIQIGQVSTVCETTFKVGLRRVLFSFFERCRKAAER